MEGSTKRGFGRGSTENRKKGEEGAQGALYRGRRGAVQAGWAEPGELGCFRQGCRRLPKRRRRAHAPWGGGLL